MYELLTERIDVVKDLCHDDDLEKICSGAHGDIKQWAHPFYGFRFALTNTSEPCQ